MLGLGLGAGALDLYVGFLDVDGVGGGGEVVLRSTEGGLLLYLFVIQAIQQSLQSEAVCVSTEVSLARFYPQATLLARLLFGLIAFLPHKIFVIELLFKYFQPLIPFPQYLLNLDDTFLQIFIDIPLSLYPFRETGSYFFR